MKIKLNYGPLLELMIVLWIVLGLAMVLFEVRYPCWMVVILSVVSVIVVAKRITKKKEE